MNINTGVGSTLIESISVPTSNSFQNDFPLVALISHCIATFRKNCSDQVSAYFCIQFLRIYVMLVWTILSMVRFFFYSNIMNILLQERSGRVKSAIFRNNFHTKESFILNFSIFTGNGRRKVLFHLKASFVGILLKN